MYIRPITTGWQTLFMLLMIVIPVSVHATLNKILIDKHDVAHHEHNGTHSAILYFGTANCGFVYQRAFKSGILPAELAKTTCKHKKQAVQHDFVRLTFSFENAAEYASEEDLNAIRYVYVTNVPWIGAVNKLSGALISKYGHGDVLFPDGIRSENIMGVFVLRRKADSKTGEFSQYISNPGYLNHDTSDTSGTFDVLPSTYDSHIKLTFSPAGKSVDKLVTRYPRYQYDSRITQIVVGTSTGEVVNWSRTRTSEKPEGYFATRMGSTCALIYSDSLLDRMLAVNASRLNESRMKLLTCRYLGPLISPDLNPVTAVVREEYTGIQDMTLSIHWTLPENIPRNIKGFRIYSADGPDAGKLIATLPGSSTSGIVLFQSQLSSLDLKALNGIIISKVLNTVPESESVDNDYATVVHVKSQGVTTYQVPEK